MRQGRTDAWIAHQLDVSVPDIRGFKRDHGLVPDGDEGDGDGFTPADQEEPDLRAEDDALVAAALEAELDEEDEEPEEREAAAAEDAPAEDGDGDEGDDKPKRRRRGRRGGRGRRKGGPRKPLEGTFDHGDEGYGLWLDPAVQDDPVYAEHWAGHRPVVVTVDAERIVITRAGEDGGADDDES